MMDDGEIETACRTLERFWLARDYVTCCAVLADADCKGVSAEAEALDLLATCVLPLTTDDPQHQGSEGLDRFRQLRSDILERAADRDTDLLLGLRADALAVKESTLEWAASLYNYIILRSETIGARRPRLWESAALIQWATGRLLETCRLGERSLAGLLVALHRTHEHLNWEIPGPGVLKTILLEERVKLQDHFVAQLLELARRGSMREPEAFIHFDQDGRLLPALVGEILKLGPRHANSVALLYFLAHRGDLTSADFLSRVANFCVFINTGRRCLLVAGDFLPTTLCRTLHQQSDITDRPIHLTWWLNVNFPREQLGHAMFIATRIPLFVRALLAHGQATLFLCACAEASWFSPRWAEWIADLAKLLGCRPDQIVYLPQNVRFGDDHAAFRAAAGSSTDPRVIPFNTHLLIGGLRAEPEVALPAKRFLCFNQRSHIHRVALLLGLRRDGVTDMHLSFNQPIRAEMPLSGAVLEPWLEMAPKAIDALIAETERSLPIRLDLAGDGHSFKSDGNYTDAFNARLFADAAVYLVTESEMDDRSMCRFTEKTVKGIAACIPFIVFGNAGTLASLKDLGFRTFSPFIDESYDAIEDPILRFRRAYGEVLRLNALPKPALIGLRDVLKTVLDHNRRHLLGIEPILHDRLALAIDGEAIQPVQLSPSPPGALLRRYAAAS